MRPRGGYLRRVSDAALVAVGGAAILTAVALSLFHLDDRYMVSRVSGAWMGLAADAFIVRRLDEQDADRLRVLVERQAFAHIVLLAPATDPVQYSSFDFTPEIAAAIRSRYRLATRVPEASL